MDFRGKIEMKNPDITLACFEECMRICPRPPNHSDAPMSEDPDKHGTTREKTEGDGEFDEVWFGRLVRSILPYGVLLVDGRFFR